MNDNVWERADRLFAHVWELRQTWRCLINAPSSRLGTTEWITDVLECWKEASRLRAPFADPRHPSREFHESVCRLLDVYNANTAGTEYLKSVDQPSLEIIEVVYMSHIEAEYRRTCMDVESEKELIAKRQAMNREKQLRENQRRQAAENGTVAQAQADSLDQDNDPWSKYNDQAGDGNASSLPIRSAAVDGNANSNVGSNVQSQFTDDEHKHGCICGISHAGGIPGCFYLIPELRPGKFVIRESVLTRIKRTLTHDPSLQVYIDKARAKFHGGIVPPPLEDYDISPTATPSMVSSGALPAGSIAPSASASNWPATTSDEYEPSKDHETATYTTAKGGSGEAATAEAAAAAATKTSTGKPVTHALKNSWILSISCNICVCNDRSRLDNFEEAEPGTTVYAHGQELVVTGRGKAEVCMTAAGGMGEQFVTFPDVWCVPDYYTNIIALDALEQANITWEHREDLLLMEGEPWCKLKRVNGMRVLEYTPLQLEIL